MTLPANEFLPHPDYPGLVFIGGEVNGTTLLDSYRRGIFPWFSEGDPKLWWSPDPRAILELEQLHISRRLERTIRSPKFRCTFDRDFSAVVQGCADRAEGTWINPEMLAAYDELHRLGHAHSVEVWHGEELAGGVFGVALGGFFAGESMFHRVRDASKVALATLIERLRSGGFLLFDLQFLTPHTASLGAREIPRPEYLRRLRLALDGDAIFL